MLADYEFAASLTSGSCPERSTIHIKENMARITSEKAAAMIGNKFDMILIASIRAKELKKGHLPKVVCDNGPNVTAIREIEEGLIGREYLSKVNKK